MSNGSLEQQYHSIYMSGGFFKGGHGIVHLFGAESLELLHRISTNSLLDLPVNSARHTVLPTEKAKIIDLVIVVRRPYGVLLVTSKQQSNRVKLWIEKFIITEIIDITDRTNDYSTVSIILPKGYSTKLISDVVSEYQTEATVFVDPLWHNVTTHHIVDRNEIINAITIRLKNFLTLIDEGVFGIVEN